MADRDEKLPLEQAASTSSHDDKLGVVAGVIFACLIVIVACLYKYGF